jgi:hypothetical protein
MADHPPHPVELAQQRREARLTPLVQGCVKSQHPPILARRPASPAVTGFLTADLWVGRFAVSRFRKVATSLTLVITCAATIVACGGGGSTQANQNGAFPTACPGHRMKTSEIRVANEAVGGLGKETVPGNPTKLLMCRYFGPEEPTREGQLAQSSTIYERRVITGMAGYLTNRAGEVGGTSATCEAEDEGPALAFFGYPDGSAVELSIDLSGCRFSTNGSRLVESSEARTRKMAGLVGG